MTTADRLPHCTTTWAGHSPACDRDGAYCALDAQHDGPCKPHGTPTFPPSAPDDQPSTPDAQGFASTSYELAEKGDDRLSVAYAELATARASRRYVDEQEQPYVAERIAELRAEIAALTQPRDIGFLVTFTDVPPALVAQLRESFGAVLDMTLDTWLDMTVDIDDDTSDALGALNTTRSEA